MKVLIGTVVAVDMEATIQKKGGGTYKGVEFTFKTEDGKINTKAFHENQFKFNQALQNTLADLNKGDRFTAEMEKEGEFWNWKKLSKGVAENTAPKQEANASAGKQPYTPRPNDTYETKEERAARQVMIVRQSSLTNALKLLELHGNKRVTTRDVVSLAQEFEAYVLDKAPKELTILGSLEDLENNNPFEDGVE